MSGTSYLPDSAYKPRPGRPIKGVGGHLVVHDVYEVPWELFIMTVLSTCREYGAAPVGRLEGGSFEREDIPGAQVLWWGLTLARPVPAE
jgi:hypothetical protein